LRRAAVDAERIAVRYQQAGLAEPSGPAPDPAVIGGLQLVSDLLHHASVSLDPPPPTTLRQAIESFSTIGLWAGAGTAVLLLAPHPDRPWVITVAVAAGYGLAGLWGMLFSALWTQAEIRGLARAPRPRTLPRERARLRTRIGVAIDRLDRSPAPPDVRDQLEYALAWLDEVDRVA
jgi:hypothetical protein